MDVAVLIYYLFCTLLTEMEVAEFILIVSSKFNTLLIFFEANFLIHFSKLYCSYPGVLIFLLFSDHISRQGICYFILRLGSNCSLPFELIIPIKPYILLQPLILFANCFHSYSFQYPSFLFYQASFFYTDEVNFIFVH